MWNIINICLIISFTKILSAFLKFKKKIKKSLVHNNPKSGFIWRWWWIPIKLILLSLWSYFITRLLSDWKSVGDETLIKEIKIKNNFHMMTNLSLSAYWTFTFYLFRKKESFKYFAPWPKRYKTFIYIDSGKSTC